MNEVAFNKLKHFCAYQERCHKEVRDKCYELGVHRDEAEQMIVLLVEENYLNEERFAKAFAGGKFRMKHWGRNRITMELKRRDISAYCIKVAMKEIDADDYYKALLKEAGKKYHSLEKIQGYQRTYKTMQYLMQRGFEQDLSKMAIEEIANSAE
ncbi:regulatory protein [Chitinophaga skermanii]|uniref:Regulatory protein RecX n=1 Tax=Chitinophaga skermanii TaxID=331697 RepID=A0A327R0R6_9BACT|nr:regulatory protein RecX [Chitinophaga skermanii]RAJ10449.1 regulatory protein [Chitinophaga skermanii]